MDFEEQLEKAERSDSPSLVGSSVRSADDSPHNNYIHPEKYTGTSKKTGLSKDITASLDDLMREGALIASEEDFELVLDKEGIVKESVKYEDNKVGGGRNGLQFEPLFVHDSDSTAAAPSTGLADGTGAAESGAATTEAGEKSSTGAGTGATESSTGLYSTPNLSQYQVENQIASHDDLLAKIKQEDPHQKKPPLVTKSSFQPLPLMDHGQTGPEGFHSPYFFTDDKAESIEPGRSSSRSKSRSRAVKPHLARGDSYKYTKDEDPESYELPPDFEDERRSRQSRPTMGESIAAIEEEKVNNEKYQSQVLSRDASLLTTGDYTNFNVDSSREPSTPYEYKGSRMSTDYLRSISRSRSRQPGAVDHNEKNDANPSSLYEEGALINEDPYSTIDNLDTMVGDVIKELEEKDDKDVPVKEPETKKTDTKSVAFEANETDAGATKESELTESEIKPEDTESEAAEPESKTEEAESETKEDEPETREASESEKAEVTETDSVAQTAEKLEQLEVDDSVPKSAAKDATDKVDEGDEEPVTVKEPETSETSEPTEGTDKSIAGSGDTDASTVAADVSTKAEASDAEIKDKLQIEDPKPLEPSEPTTAGTDATEDESFDISPEELRKHLESQPVYLFTSLIGGMQVIHKTNRLQTILKANEIKFEARDLGTDDEAKKIWRRYSNGKSLPGIVRGDDFIGNWQDVEDANEEYRVRELIYETL